MSGKLVEIIIEKDTAENLLGGYSSFLGFEEEEYIEYVKRFKLSPDSAFYAVKEFFPHIEYKIDKFKNTLGLHIKTVKNAKIIYDKPTTNLNLEVILFDKTLYYFDTKDVIFK